MWFRMMFFVRIVERACKCFSCGLARGADCLFDIKCVLALTSQVPRCRKRIPGLDFYMQKSEKNKKLHSSWQ